MKKYLLIFTSTLIGVYLFIFGIYYLNAQGKIVFSFRPPYLPIFPINMAIVKGPPSGNTSPPKDTSISIPATPSLSQNQRSIVLFSSPILVALFILLITKIARSKKIYIEQDPLPTTTQEPRILPSEEKPARSIVGKIFIFILVAALLSASAFFIYKIIREKQPPVTELVPQEIIQLPIHIPTPTPTPKTVNQPISTPKPYVDDQTYACGPGGACNSYEDPKSSGCTVTFTDRFCENKCSDASIRCRY